MSRTIGYGRVSSADQNPERQKEALEAEGADVVFIDKASGKNTDRPQLTLMLEHGIRDGDVVLVTSVDRLARSTVDLLSLLEQIKAKGASVVFLENKEMNTDSAQGEFMLTVLGAVAQLERAMIKERQLEGIAIAKAKGNVYKGRKPALTDDQADELTKRLEAGEQVAALAREFGVSRQTVYNIRAHATA